MTRVVAFLRAINVGGHVVKNEQLKQVFDSLGFEGVVVHRQAGNVIFETDVKDPERVRVDLGKKLRSTLGYDVEVFIRKMSDLKRLVEKEPRAKEADVMSRLVTFLPDSIPNPLPRLPLIIPKSTVEVVSTTGREVFSLTHVIGEGGLPNQFLESKLKTKTTTRNMNVIREIVEKFG
jgi:uncharacterized protein (DUF1697 family)